MVNVSLIAEDEMAALGISREKDETWRECAIRYGRKYGLEWEITEWFDRGIAAGKPDFEAAIEAVNEWDCCDLKDH